MESFLGDKAIDIIRFYTVIVVLVIGLINIIEEIYSWLVTIDSNNNKIGQYALLILISLTLISNITWWIVEHFHRK